MADSKKTSGLSSEDEDLQSRLLIALLMPVARLAMRFQLPVKKLREFAELIYFREARAHGLKHHEIQQLMQVGMSKVASLAKQLRASQGPRQTALGLERRIIMLLWAQPLSAHKVAQAFGDDVEGKIIHQTLEQMVDENRLVRVEGRTTRYGLSSGQYRLVEDSWMARFEGLSSLMRTIQRAIEARFLEQDQHAFVRNLRFHVRDEDRPRLESFYRDALFPLVNELEEASVEHGDGRAIQLALAWADDPMADDDHRRSGGDDD